MIIVVFHDNDELKLTEQQEEIAFLEAWRSRDPMSTFYHGLTEYTVGSVKRFNTPKLKKGPYRMRRGREF